MEEILVNDMELHSRTFDINDVLKLSNAFEEDRFKGYKMLKQQIDHAQVRSCRLSRNS